MENQTENSNENLNENPVENMEKLGASNKWKKASSFYIISNALAIILVLIAITRGFMHGKYENLIFLAINITALVAVLLNVGFTEDNYNIKTKKFTKTGKVGFYIWLLSFVGLLVFLGRHIYKMSEGIPSEKIGIDTNIYLGYLITAMAYFLPFISTPHDSRVKGWPKISLTGWLIVVLGFSGMMSSVFKLLEFASDYLTVTAHFITVASSLMAISGETIRTDKEGVAHLTDLGKLSLAVIIIGFGISIINSQIEDKEKKSIMSGIATANVELVSSQKLIDTLKQNIREVDTLLMPVKGNLEEITETLLDVIDKISNTDRLLKGINRGVHKNSTHLDSVIYNLNNTVAHKSEITDMRKVTDANQLTIHAMHEEVSNIVDELDENVAKKQDVYDMKFIVEINQQKLEKLETDIPAIKSGLEKVGTDVGTLKTDLGKVSTSVSEVQKNITENMVKKSDLEEMATLATGNGDKIDALQTNITTLSGNSLSKTDLLAIQNEVKSIKSQLDSLSNNINIPKDVLQKSVFEQKIGKLESQLQKVLDKLKKQAATTTGASSNSGNTGSNTNTGTNTNDSTSVGGND